MALARPQVLLSIMLWRIILRTWFHQPCFLVCKSTSWAGISGSWSARRCSASGIILPRTWPSSLIFRWQWSLSLTSWVSRPRSGPPHQPSRGARTRPWQERIKTRITHLFIPLGYRPHVIIPSRIQLIETRYRTKRWPRLLLHKSWHYSRRTRWIRQMTRQLSAVLATNTGRPILQLMESWRLFSAILCTVMWQSILLTLSKVDITRWWEALSMIWRTRPWPRHWPLHGLASYRWSAWTWPRMSW